jgi:hypothetical protein
MGKKIYYASPFTWILPILFVLLAVFSLVFAIVVIPQIPTMESLVIMFLTIVGIIGLLFFTLYGVLIFFNIPTTRLELSNEGLIFYGTGYRIYTPWENIAGVGWTRFSHSFPALIPLKKSALVTEISFEEGIASRRAVAEKRVWWMRTRQLKANVQYTHYIRIPVVFFRRKDKQEGTINQYLWYYLPHLMENR